MTTTIEPPELRVERDPLRILSIAANLLPIEITDSRRENKVRWVVAASLVVVVALLGLWVYYAHKQTSDEDAALQKANDQVASVQREQQQFSGLKTTKSTDAALSAQLSKLMGSDVAWYELVPALETAASTAGVTITNITATASTTAGTNAVPATGATGSTAVPNEAGTIQLDGSAPDKTNVAAFLELLAKVPGFSAPYLPSLTALGPLQHYSINVSYTSSLFKGRYTTSTTAPAGGK
jgi:Tfp pilus assembly protein PilN